MIPMTKTKLFLVLDQSPKHEIFLVLNAFVLKDLHLSSAQPNAQVQAQTPPDIHPISSCHSPGPSRKTANLADPASHFQLHLHLSLRAKGSRLPKKQNKIITISHRICHASSYAPYCTSYRLRRGQGKYQQDAQKQRQCNALCLRANGPSDTGNRIILIYIGIFE